MKRKGLALLLTLVLVISLLPTSVFARVESEQITADKREEQTEGSGLNLYEELALIRDNMPQKAGETVTTADGITVSKLSGLDTQLKAQTGSSVSAAVNAAYAPTEQVRVMVVLDGAALADAVNYDRARLVGTAAAAASAAMEAEQDAVVSQICQTVNGLFEAETVETNYHYTTLLNGVSVSMPYGALEAVRSLEGIAAAFVVPTYSLPEDMTDSTADPAMSSTRYTFGSAETWDVGYTGEGMKIAIIDTGLDSDHPSFADAPSNPGMEQDDIDAVLTQLNAYERFSARSPVPLKSKNLYRSAKIAYGFNYVDNTLDITHDNDSQGDHGTHVAGITAANRIESTDVAGVAPDAQLLIMKVFGQNGGAYWDDILAALEDCILLNVDAVNMSLGSPAGFSVTDESTKEFNDWSDAVYAKVEQCDMILAIAAGNSYSASYGTPLGNNVDLASNPDNGIVSSPATYPSATVVASIENDSVMYNYITVNGQSVPYTDVAGYGFISTLTEYGETTYTYAMIDGYGTAEDFGEYNWENYYKIAVVSRGELAFTEKQSNASAAGYRALIVYNNKDDGLMNMEDGGVLPNIFISKADGALMAAAADENGEGTLVIEEGMVRVTSETAGQMSDFSSWGVSPDLTLLPDVSAPGGNIYSSIDNGQYGLMSGTSMATPHIAGMSALVLEHLHKRYANNSDTWYRTAAEALIMSTAEPVTEPTGVLYSPRKQGAGAANVYSAVTSPAYLTVNGGTPKISLGDDDAKTGVYTFSFEINNMTASAVTYWLGGTALTDQVQFIDGVAYMGETSRKLDGAFSFTVSGVSSDVYDYNGDGVFTMRDVLALLDDVNFERTVKNGYDLTGDGRVDTADAYALYKALQAASVDPETVTVPASGTVTVTATLTLSDADKMYMDVNYVNGIYVDGFVRCYELVGEGEAQHDLSLPFLAFYGDWSAAPVLDDSGWDLYNDAPNRYWSVMWTDANYSYNLGTNPYLNEARDEAHNVLSPNGDGYQDAICDLYLSMMRNAKKLTFTVCDEEGNVLHRTEDSYVRKSYYSSSYALCLPYLYNSYMDEPLYDFAGAQSGDRFTFTIEAWLDDGDDLVDDSVTIPIVIDCESPTVDADSFAFISHPNGGRQLAFDVTDNYDIAAIVTLTTAGSIIDVIPVNAKQPGSDGEAATISLDVSTYDTQFIIAMCDYGFNESYYYVSFAGEHDVDENAFYGYRNMSVIPYGSYNYATTAYNGWYSFSDASSMLMHTDAYYTGETAVQAAEYVDGWVIGVDANGDIFAMKAGSWERNVFASMGDYPSAMDMAYDFTTNTMYLITDEEYNGSGAFLLTLNLLTGELTELGRLTGFADYVIDYGYWSYTSVYGQAITLACDNDGVLYAINHADGDLYTVDPTTCTATRLASTGYSPKYYQSMTVDHATNELYWAAYQGYSGSSAFYRVDKTTGELTDATSSGIQHNAEITALYKPNLSCGDLIPDDAALTGLKISASGVTMAAGTQSILTVSASPYYAELGDVTWTSGDENVVTVENGVLTAIAEGSATVKASAGGQTAECVVTVIKVEADLMLYDAGDGMNWLSFAANAPQNAVDANGMTPYDASYNYFIAAAYAHDTVYAFDYYGGFYRMDAETMQGTRLGVNNAVNGTNGIVLAMSFNYSDGYLYGITQSVSGWDSYYHLVRINPANGQLVKVGEIDAYSYGTPVNLAVDRSGRFYTIMDVTDYDTWESVSRIFTFTADDVYDGYVAMEAGAKLLDFVPSDSASVSSLVWSEDNSCLFWANYFGQLLRIDPTTGATLNLGVIGSTAGNESIMNNCLFELPVSEPGAVEGVEITGLTMQQSLRLLVGSSISVNVSVEPWNATASFTFAVENSSIATVSETGVLTGVAVGETTLTVTESSTGKVLTASVAVAPSTGKVYGLVVQDLNNGANYWTAIPDTDPLNIEPIKSFADTGFAPYAGAYYDGYLYVYSHAIEEMTSVDGFDYEYRYYLLKVDPVDYSFEILGNNRRVHESIMDMAFDYSTGTMYGVVYRTLNSSALVQIDLETAEIVTVGYVNDKLDLRTLTVDENGQLYSVSTDGNLYRLNKLTGEATLVGATGVGNLNVYQSMHYDYDTGNTYWAQYGSDGSNGLMLLDLESGASTNLGSIDGVGASVACLYTVSESTPALPEAVQPTGISLSEKQTVVVGNTLTLNAHVLPLSVVGVDQTLTWSSDNEAVATVANGVVTGVSAGTAVITATTANGLSASCSVTVTAEARRFYAYDETATQWISFTADDPSETRVERTDAEGESKILASLYHDGKLYSYTADGKFWSLDPNTFERTLISEDLADMYAAVETTDWWGNVESNYYKLMPLSMAYDEQADQAYVQMMAYEVFDYGYDFYSFYGLMLLPIDLATGKVDYTMETITMMDYDTWESYEVEVKVIASTCYQTAEAFTNAVLVHDGVAVFVDTFTSGMVTCFDLASGECVQTALINNYWGNAEHGRGMYEDPLTGTTYIVRDMRDWGGPVTLNTIVLSDADITSLGTVGMEDHIVNSLFIK